MPRSFTVSTADQAPANV